MRNDSDDKTELFLTKSVHNETYEVFVFRSLLTEQFESALKHAKGKQRSLKFNVLNVSNNEADTLFCAIAEKLDEEKLKKTFVVRLKKNIIVGYIHLKKQLSNKYSKNIFVRFIFL